MLKCPNCKKENWKSVTTRKNGKALSPNGAPYDNSKDNFLVCKNCKCLITTTTDEKNISNIYVSYWMK